MKLVMFLIDAIFWIWIFIVPAGICAFGGFLLHNASHHYLPFSILITLAGAVAGFFLAEYIRKKYGLADFFGKLLSTPELDHERDK
ncbi:MAG TPA: hypothetical protein VFZ78_06995 [Flavisolibacter sp.]